MIQTVLPVDLADLSGIRPLEADRWAVVWWVEGSRHEAYITDRALAQAYAAARRGQVVRLAALDPWPTLE
jgi:hypothetical protein